MPGCGGGCKFGGYRDIPVAVRTCTRILNWVPCPGLNRKKTTGSYWREIKFLKTTLIDLCCRKFRDAAAVLYRPCVCASESSDFMALYKSVFNINI